MKTTTFSQIAAMLVIGFGLATTSQGQTYQVNGALNGLDFTISDTASTFGYFNTGDGTISRTVVIDSTTSTIRVFGSLSLPASTQSASLTESQTFTVTTPPVFPNPPSTSIKTVIGNLNVSTAFAGGTFQFDTGVKPVTWDGFEYVFDGKINVALPINLAFSLTTDNQTLSGMANSINFGLNVGRVVDVANYPSSIGLASAGTDYSQFLLTTLTAENGFNTQLQVVVPEPTTFSMIALAMVGFTFIRRRHC